MEDLGGGGKIGQEVQYEVHHMRDCDFTTVTNFLVRNLSVECGRPWGGKRCEVHHMRDCDFTTVTTMYTVPLA